MPHCFVGRGRKNSQIQMTLTLLCSGQPFKYILTGEYFMILQAVYSSEYGFHHNRHSLGIGFKLSTNVEKLGIRRCIQAGQRWASVIKPGPARLGQVATGRFSESPSEFSPEPITFDEYFACITAFTEASSQKNSINFFIFLLKPSLSIMISHLAAYNQEMRSQV